MLGIPCDPVVQVVDSADSARLYDCRAELHAIHANNT